MGEHYYSPWLMYDNHKSVNQWRFTQPNTFFHKRFPKFEDAMIQFSNHGWLLMMPRDNTIFFLDPFNDRTIQLPTPPIQCMFRTICFFHPPTSPECFVVGIERSIEYPNYSVRIWMLRRGDREWKNHTYGPKRGLCDLSLAPPVLKNGLLYFMDVKGNVATFDISKHGLMIDAWSVYSRCIRQRRLRKHGKIFEHFLIKPEGEDSIFAVFEIGLERCVKVYRLLEPAMSWELVHDLGERVFYVSFTSSHSLGTHDKNMANKILFPKFHGDKLVYYSLDTGKYHSFDGDYSSRDFEGLKRFNSATWTMPTKEFNPGDRLSWGEQVDDTAS